MILLPKSSLVIGKVDICPGPPLSRGPQIHHVMKMVFRSILGGSEMKKNALLVVFGQKSFNFQGRKIAIKKIKKEAKLKFLRALAIDILKHWLHYKPGRHLRTILKIFSTEQK